MRPKVYLAGYSGEIEYRKTVNKKYGNVIDVFDPMIEVEGLINPEDVKKVLCKERPYTKEEITKVVEGDKEAIRTCDVLVAYMTRYSAGTIMEILHSYNNNVPVLLIDPQKSFRKDVWVSYHIAKAFDSIDDCFNYIIGLING